MGETEKDPKKFGMRINLRKLAKTENMFEFSITTPTLKSQFLVPRKMLNDLRVLIEKVLTQKED